MRLPFFCLVINLAVFLTSGCSTSPSSQHYFLTPLAVREGLAVGTNQPTGMAVAVVPIRIARYIDRPQIVTRIGPNEIYVDEFNRWAGSLKDNIGNVLVQNLTALLADAQVARHPVPTAMSIDYQVFVDIIQFDATPDQSITLIANWAVIQKNTDTPPTMRYHQFNMNMPYDTKDYKIMIAAQSRLLADISYEIAQTLISLQTDRVVENQNLGIADPQ